MLFLLALLFQFINDVWGKGQILSLYTIYLERLRHEAEYPFKITKMQTVVNKSACDKLCLSRLAWILL